MRRGRRLLLALLAAASGYAMTPPPPFPVTPLREVQRLPRTDGIAVWVVPARCDLAGNVFLLPMPTATAVPPRDVVRLAVRGPAVLRFDIGAVPDLRAVGAVQTRALAVDPRGGLHAVVSTPTEERRAARQYVVSFDPSGKYRSATEVDPSREMEIDAIEVFPSGAFLLQGRRGQANRLAVMSRGTLQDVSSATPGEGAASRFDYLARGGDGRVYAAQRDSGSIVAIDDRGRSREAFAVSPVFAEQRIDGLWASGRRVVLAHEDETDPKRRSQLAVYDVVSARLAATYGPVEGMPACYDGSSPETFTFLRPDVRTRLSP